MSSRWLPTCSAASRPASDARTASPGGRSPSNGWPPPPRPAARHRRRRALYVAVDDRVYWVSDDGVAWCVDAATGETVWRERLGGNFSASPLAAATNGAAIRAEGGIVPTIA